MSNPETLPYIPDSELLPAEYSVDPYSPAGDKFFQRIRIVEKQIMSVTGDLVRAWHLDAVKLHYNGMGNKEIGKKLGRSAGRVGIVLNSEECQRLLALMRLMAMLRDGPLEAQRKDLLWRIAIDNELKSPRISVAAVAEINKMDGVYDKDVGQGNLTVVIQNQVLGKSELDK